MSSSVQSLIDYGSNGLIVDIECHLSNNLPTIVIVGFGNKAVGEARERVRGAFSSCGMDLPRKRITINLAPADIPKASTSFDLAIAAAIILAAVERRNSSKSMGSRKASAHTTQRTLSGTEAVMGELGLDGAIRPVRGIIGKILAGRSRGVDTFYIPAANLPQAALVPGVNLVPLSRLSELHDYLSGTTELSPLATGDMGIIVPEPPDTVVAHRDSIIQSVSLSDIVGQEQAKRALQIAAAGGHNLLLSGPPGTGKSMLARALPSVLPELSAEEKLEVTQLHSLAGHEYDRIITERPFRAPHHSASHISVIGGGSALRPGEISLAHRGVLFFDELPEFQRSTIEALRQPLEDRTIAIARAGGQVEFPASFILVATANPCPCGFYGLSSLSEQAQHCQCPPAAIQRYRGKLSGPILDRIDLYSDVHSVDHGSLLGSASAAGATNDAVIRERIAHARQHQLARNSGGRLNAALNNRDIAKYGQLSVPAKALLDLAGHNLKLSTRAYMRTAKVARTIADMDGSAAITEAHITEALQYRSRSL